MKSRLILTLLTFLTFSFVVSADQTTNQVRSNVQVELPKLIGELGDILPVIAGSGDLTIPQEQKDALRVVTGKLSEFFLHGLAVNDMHTMLAMVKSKKARAEAWGAYELQMQDYHQKPMGEILNEVDRQLQILKPPVSGHASKARRVAKEAFQLINAAKLSDFETRYDRE
jgi:hypothetical protein